MKRFRCCALLCAALCSPLITTSRAAGQAIFQNLGSGSYSSMSRNGQHVVTVQSNGDVYRFSPVTGQATLAVNVGVNGFATAVSDDGGILVGYRRNPSNQTIGFRWTAATGFVDLGDLPGGSTFSIPYGMSADGNVIVGDSASTASGTRTEAFRWTPGGGIQPLGDLPGGNYTERCGLSVSADGSVIVGYSNQTAGYEAYRWTSGSGMSGLGDIPGGYFNSQAYKISSDGTVIVGYSSDELNREQTFRWTQAGGMVPLGFGSSDPNEWSQGHGSSADGNVIVGNNNTGATLADVKALIWDPTHGMRHLQEALLADYGLTLPAGWRLTDAWDVSDNGRIIAGAGYNPSGVREGWVVSIVPEPAMLLPLLFLAMFGRSRRSQRS